MDLSVDDMCEIWSIVDNIRGLRGGVNVKGACHGERGKCECRVDIQDSVEGDVVSYLHRTILTVTITE
jgi:hypothetical protein